MLTNTELHENCFRINRTIENRSQIRDSKYATLGQNKLFKNYFSTANLTETL